MDRRRYIQTVTDQIRCKRALPLVTKELEDHIEDQKCDYMTEGMEPSEAEEAAVLEMGDPVEVGIEMDRIHRPKMAWKMIGLIAVLNLAGILLMYCLRTSALADVGNNPGEIEGITSGIGGNIDYLKNIAWTFAGLACMIGICYVDYSWIGKYAKQAGRHMDRSNGTGYIHGSGVYQRCGIRNSVFIRYGITVTAAVISDRTAICSNII